MICYSFAARVVALPNTMSKNQTNFCEREIVFDATIIDGT
jgi:hypothetical protein